MSIAELLGIQRLGFQHLHLQLPVLHDSSRARADAVHEAFIIQPCHNPVSFIFILCHKNRNPHAKKPPKKKNLTTCISDYLLFRLPSPKSFLISASASAEPSSQ